MQWKYTGWRRWLIGVWAVAEILFLGGLVNGWASLVLLLKQRHIFENLCEASPNTSNYTRITTNLSSSPYDVIGNEAFADVKSKFNKFRTSDDTRSTTSSNMADNFSMRIKRDVHINKFVKSFNCSGKLCFKSNNSQLSDPNAEDNILRPNGDKSIVYDIAIILKHMKEYPSINFFYPIRGISILSYSEFIKFRPNLHKLRHKRDADDPVKFQGTFNETIKPEVTSSNQNISCEKQDAMFVLGFTVMSVVQPVGCVLFGQAQRKMGIRVTRIVSGIIYISGLLMVGLITPDHPYLLFGGMGFVAVAGLNLLTTNIQLGVLFGRGQTTYVGILSGFYDVSSIVQLCIKIVITAGVDYFWTYAFLSAFSSLTLISTFLWIPHKSSVVLDKHHTADGRTKILEAGAVPQSLQDKTSERTSYVTSSKLWLNIRSPHFLLHVGWLSILQLQFVFFLGILNSWLTQLAEGNIGTVDYFTSIQLYTGITALLFAPLAGSLYDLLRKKYTKSSVPEKKVLLPAVIPLFLGSGLCCLLTGLMLVPGLNVLYVTFIVFHAFRSFLYSVGAAFLALTFPPELFGVLYGIMNIVGAVVSCLQYPLFIWAGMAYRSITHVGILLLSLSLVSFVHPCFILWRCHKKQPSLSSLQLASESYSTHM